MKGSTASNLNINKLAGQAATFKDRGEFAQAARFYRLAGMAAVTQYACEAAVTHLSEALILTPDAQSRQRYRILLARERVYALQGEHKRQGRDLASLSTLADSLQDDAKRAEVAVRQAQYYCATGELTTAVAIARLSVRLAALAGSKRIEAVGRIAWGDALLQQGSYDAAGQQLSQALALAQAIEDHQVEADGVRMIGLHFMNRGDLSQARLAYDKALELYANCADRLGHSYVLNNLGHIAYDQGRYDEAGRYWGEVLPAYRSLGDRTGEAMVLNNLGSLNLDIGNYDQASTYQQSVLEISRQIKSRFGEGLALVNLSLVHHYRNENDMALENGQQAAVIAAEMGNRRLEGYALAAIGHAQSALNQPGQARDAYWQSLAIWEELGQPNLVAAQQAGLAQVALAGGAVDEALGHAHAAAEQIAREPGLDGVESPLRVYLTCYLALQAANQIEKADELLNAAHERLQEQAAAITDAEKRQAFLNQVTINRQIQDEFSS